MRLSHQEQLREQDSRETAPLGATILEQDSRETVPFGPFFSRQSG